MITLERRFHDQIVQQAFHELPNEACGLIAAKEGTPIRLYPMRNADESPTTYRIDSEELRHVLYDEIEDGGLELYAIYHSHTHTEAYPSPTDRRQAFYPEAYYLLVSLADRDAPVLRGFRILDGEVTEEEVRIE